MRQRAKEEVESATFDMIIGSVMCTDWSISMNINIERMGKEEWDRRMVRARIHLAFVCELYMIQVRNNRYDLHGHPSTARSWSEQCVQKVMEDSTAWVVRAHMCRFGMRTETAENGGLSFKPTDFMTNSIYVADQLDKQCLNIAGGKTYHEHLRLESGRPKQAQFYPEELGRAICRGLRD